jgi:SAM-dependent methyltransferase
MTLAYHQWMGRLGRGDLHPGGVESTRLGLDWLGKGEGRRVLEVGAGIGRTSARLRDAGWTVTALEPDPILIAALRRVPGIEVLHMPIEALPNRRFDALVAESVLYALDLPALLPLLRGRLSPSGTLLFSDMVWVPGVSPSVSAAAHRESFQSFGIAGVSRAPWDWDDWRRMLTTAELEVVREVRLGTGSPGGHTEPDEPVAALGTRLVTLPARVRHRLATRRQTTPSALLESWLCLARARGV